MKTTLYDKYGGFSGISPIVSNFYDKILKEDSLAGYFNNVDMERLIDHQTRFLCVALGGPAEYKGKQLKTAHTHLNITDGAFAKVAGILKEALEEAGVEPGDVTAILGIVASTKGDIVKT
jgi:hemoglobin